MTLKYKNKRVLIVGGSSEMGLNLADLCIKSDLYPVLTYRSDKGKNTIDSFFMNCEKYSTQYFDLEKKTCIKDLPEIDYMVDFSQSEYESLIINSDRREVEKYFTTNLLTKSLLLSHLTSSMTKNKFGRLIFISSTAVIRINPGQGFYAASKSAVESLYDTLGVELAGLGITTAIIRPGYVDAGRCRKYFNNTKINIKKIIPIKKLISKNDVCETIMFLLSDSALSINSTTITLDGGLSASKRVL